MSLGADQPSVDEDAPSDGRSVVRNRPGWTFLTNHGHALVCISQNPDIRLAEIAAIVGIGERAAHRIVHDLIDAGYVSGTRVGRRTVYSVDLHRPLRHPLESTHSIGSAFAALVRPPGSDPDPEIPG